jgi:signal transduction histidine kinase
MAQDERYKHRRRGNLYGVFAFGTVVLSCYANFFMRQRFYTSEWMALVVFALGGFYAAYGILMPSTGCGLGRSGPKYYFLQCVVLTLILWLSPSRGFMGLIVLPLAAQSIFDLSGKAAALVTGYLFAMSIAVLTYPFGWSGGVQAVLSYSTGFAFTVVFSLMTRSALTARERETKLRKEVEGVNQQLRDHALQAEELATTRERNRVAREIHDGVGHYLTVIKTQLDAAQAIWETQPEHAKTTVAKATKLAADALDDVRRSVGALRTEMAQVPLPELLRALVDESGLPVALRIEGNPRPLSAAVEHAVFRSVQESLTNVRKHAMASSVQIELDFRGPGTVALTVDDDGVGAHGASGGGFGLRGIRERVEVLGGRLDAGNRADKGFSLKIELPA